MRHAGIDVQKDIVSVVKKVDSVGVHRQLCAFCDEKTPLPDAEHLAYCVQDNHAFTAPLGTGETYYWPEGWMKLVDDEDEHAVCPSCVAKFPKWK